VVELVSVLVRRLRQLTHRFAVNAPACRPQDDGGANQHNDGRHKQRQQKQRSGHNQSPHTVESAAAARVGRLSSA